MMVIPDYQHTASPEAMDLNSTDGMELMNHTAFNFANATMATLAADSDYNASMSSYYMQLMRFVCETLIAMPLSLLGICGNILSFIVLCHQKQKLTTSVLLQALAVTDILILIVTILLRSLRYLDYFNLHLMDAYTDKYHYIFMYLYPSVYFLRLVEMWFTVLLTIDRFIAVCKPLHAQHLCTAPKAYRNMLIAIVASLLFCLPRYFEYEFSDNKDNPYGFESTKLVRDFTYTVVYRIILFFIVMYILPMTIMVALNSKLLLTLHRADTYRAALQDPSHSATPRPRRSITIIVVSVVVTCVLCNIVAMTTHLIWSLTECFSHLRYLTTTRRPMAQISNVLVTVNASINFVIYCFCSRNFRGQLRKMLGCQRVRNRFKSTSSTGPGNASLISYLSIRHSATFKKQNGTHILTSTM